MKKTTMKKTTTIERRRRSARHHEPIEPFQPFRERERERSLSRCCFSSGVSLARRSAAWRSVAFTCWMIIPTKVSDGLGCWRNRRLSSI